MSKIKITTTKNKQGGYSSRARVYSDDGTLISEHETTGATAQESNDNVLYKTEYEYSDETVGGEYDVSNASIEYETTLDTNSSSRITTTAMTEGESGDLNPGSQTASGTAIPESQSGQRLAQAAFAARADYENQSPEPARIDTPPSRPVAPKFIKGQTSCVHHLRPDPEQDGKYGSILSEPVPDRFSRDGDCILSAKTLKMGHDNNTMIVMGQDRTGIGEWNSPPGIDTPRSKNVASGYSECMGAGAIDIVVGRMAPFPVPLDGGELGPLFNTIGSRTKKHPNLINVDLISDTGTEFGHPGFMMDAARIYISQMSDIDHNFKISKQIARNSDTITRKPTSGIVIKADKVRMHARNDIKIVTGGEHEQYTSMGLDNTGKPGGIHLMAGNGLSDGQEPIPKGYKLMAAFDRVMKLHKAYVKLVTGFISTQMKLNKHMATHFHQSPAMGASTTPSIVGWAMGARSSLEHFGNYIGEVPKHDSNVAKFTRDFLIYGKNNSYINSRHNTTN